MVWYIAGPMSGIPQFNYPAFIEAATTLRGYGMTIVSPAELDSQLMHDIAMASKTGTLAEMEKLSGETWGDVLARDVKLVADKVDGICVLPGWQKSRGARLECFVGLLTNKQFAEYYDGGFMRIPARFIRDAIQGNMP
jgi:hypothetical protein